MAKRASMSLSVVQIVDDVSDKPKGPHRPLAGALIGIPCEPENGVATRYCELVWLLRRARESRRISHLEFDSIAGFQDGYTGKIEHPDAAWGRTVGSAMLPLWIAALRKIGYGISVVPLDKTIDRLELGRQRVTHIRASSAH